MGEVLEAVKGSGSTRKAKTANTQNIVDQVRALRDEVGVLTEKKDDDVLTEGDGAKPENTRKAATLRAASSLLLAVQTLLEDY